MSSELYSIQHAIHKTHSGGRYPRKPITEIITNGFFTVDRKWNVKYWNKAAEKLLGVRSGDILGKNLWEEFVGVIPINFYQVYHKAFLQDIPVHFEEYWGEMGAWFDVITYYCDDTLSVSFKTGNRPEIPDHSVSTSQQLRTLNDLYRFVTEVTNDCLWEWDLESKELFWIDGGHKRVFGYPIENALIPQSFWENRLHPEDKPRVLNALIKFLSQSSNPVWEIEYRFQRANGEYAWVHDRGHIVFDEEKNSSRMIGATQDITKNVLLENKLTRERTSDQRKLTEAVLIAQEKEREEIGKELHDNLNQVLAMAKLYIELAKPESKKRKFYLEKSAGFISTVIEDIRKISKSLAYPGIQTFGLYDNIHNLMADMSAIHSLDIKFNGKTVNEDELGPKLQLTIFRIIQEQINNILKHAQATLVTIDLTRKESKVILRVRDNGGGCDISQENSGVGLLNIKNRAVLYGGSMSIVSKPGEGYELKIVLPINQPH